MFYMVILKCGITSKLVPYISHQNSFTEPRSVDFMLILTVCYPLFENDSPLHVHQYLITEHPQSSRSDISYQVSKHIASL